MTDGFVLNQDKSLQFTFSVTSAKQNRLPERFESTVSNRDKVSCSRTQHLLLAEVKPAHWLTQDLESDALLLDNSPTSHTYTLRFCYLHVYTI